MSIVTMRSGQLSSKEWSRIVATARAVRDAPLFMDDSRALSLEDIEAKTKEVAEEKPINVIVIDDLQAIQIHPTGGKDKTHVCRAANRLRSLAEGVGAAVLLLLSEDSEAIGAIGDEIGNWVEQADFAASLVRSEKDIAGITVLRNRVGGLGTIEMVFLEENVSFRNLDPEYRADA